jgi:hypothetical protein
MLADRLIRVYVGDRKGNPIPNATVKVFLNDVFFAKATAGRDRHGSVYTIQVSDSKASVRLEAEYDGEQPLSATLAPEADEWHFTFSNVDISTPGTTPFVERHLPGVVGAAFLLITIVLSLVIPTPTSFQRRVFIGTLSIALSGMAVEIPGLLNVRMTLGRKLVITAAGAIAIFVLVYVLSPS